MAENGVSSSDVADSFQKPSTCPPEGAVTSDAGTVTQGFKQECDFLGSQLSSNSSQQSKAPPSLCSSSSSSAPSPSSSSTQRPSQSTQCGREPKPARVSPRTVIMSRAAYNLLAGESGSQLSSSSLLPHADVAWSSPLRPLITPNLQGADQSMYYRQWTVTRQHHADYEAPPVPHPRRLLLSGPPQVTALPSECIVNSISIEVNLSEDILIYLQRVKGEDDLRLVWDKLRFYFKMPNLICYFDKLFEEF